MRAQARFSSPWYYAVLAILSVVCVISLRGQATPPPEEVPPESVIEAVTRDAISLRCESPMSGSPRVGDYDVTHDDSGRVIGFGFTNPGPNRTVTLTEEEVGEGPSRHFAMSFQDRARQDMGLIVTDQAKDPALSNLMESLILFFPRKVIPAIQWSDDRFTVVLPTGETVLFDAKTFEMVGGVLQEPAPLDLEADRLKRKFARISYSGAGVMVRADRRGGMPQSAPTAVITKGAKTCKIASAKLWEQDKSFSFRFPTDAGFDSFLRKNCGFGIE